MKITGNSWFARAARIGGGRHIHITLEAGDSVSITRYDARSMNVQGNVEITGRSTIVSVEADEIGGDPHEP